MSKISLSHLTGEIFPELTTFHGIKISISLFIVEAAGHKEQPAQLLTALILLETELGLISLYLLKSSSTAKQVEAAMEVIPEGSMPLPSPTVSPKKAVKTIWLKTLINSLALLFKNAKIALILRPKSQEIKEIAGLLLVTLFGK
jgi:hypothetical protein